jgi:acyl carrier protein
MPTADDISERVTKVLSDALGVDDDIKPSSTLQGDLGAESIDFLDIVFRLEREFGIKVLQGELFPERILLGNLAIIERGRLTDDGLAALQAHLPYADWRKREYDRRLDQIEDLFTVDLVTSYVRYKLGGNGAAKTDADSSPASLSSAI